jgi:hypothetical protein
MSYRLLPGLLAVALLVRAASPLAQTGQDLAVKLLELEARLDQLSRRVEVLEAGAQANMGTDSAMRLGKDLAWHFDAYVGETPFKVSQQELDRKTGRVDLLLNLVAEPADAALWRSAQPGAPVPLEVTATLSGGGTLGPVPLTLLRRTAFTVGTHVHVSAQLPGEDHKAVRRLAIRHAGSR